MITDPRENLLLCNGRLAEILHYESPQSLQGASFGQLHISEEMHSQFVWHHLHTLHNERQLQVEYPLKAADGREVWCSLSGSSLRPQEEGWPDLYLWAVDDISQSVEVRRRLKKMATLDSLTGILNRGQFFRLAKQEFTRWQRYGGPFSVLAIDLDHFKQVNDTYGHHTGDEVLRKVTRVCADMMREQDIFGRTGGEEFAVILPQTGDEGAYRMAERLCLTVAESEMGTSRGSLRVSLSVGVATARDCEPDFIGLLGKADAALYIAKNKGRNRVAVYSK